MTQPSDLILAFPHVKEAIDTRHDGKLVSREIGDWNLAGLVLSRRKLVSRAGGLD